MKEILEKIKAYRFPLLILAIGIALMLIPSAARSGAKEEGSLGEALSMTQGVGEAYVLISDKGVVVVCDGAGNAATRLEIITAVKTYTGFGADQITVLKRNR